MRVLQINIIEDNNEFNVQSPSVGQITAKDEQGVQDAVKELVTKLLATKEANRYGTQTIKRFNKEGKEN